MLTKEKAINKIEITEDGVIQYREVTRIFEDGKVISSSNTDRQCIEPGSDVTIVDPKVLKIRDIVHDDKTVKAFLSKKLKKLKDSGIDGFEDEIAKIEAKIKKCEEKSK